MRQFRTVAEGIAEVGQHYPDNGYTFQDMAGVETRYSFVEMEQQTARRAAALQALGLKKGDRAGVVVVEPEDFVLCFLACLRIGVVPVPLYPPLSMGGLDAYADKTATILETSRSRVLLASTKLQNVLWSLVDRVETLERLVKVEDLREAEGNPDYPQIDPDDLCFLQYTSGSTSDPKGVMVTHRALAANATAIIRDGLDLDPTIDSGVSWLPLYHDMGLIGFVIAPMMFGVSCVFIPTLRFLRHPKSWFDTIHEHRGTITFAPNFAFALASRKTKDKDLERWDLSCMKAMGCGAEPIHADTIRGFIERFSPTTGLPRNVVLPAYGMAEATLAMSFKPVLGTMVTRLVDAETFEGHGRVVEPGDGPAIEHVSCGSTFPDHDIAVLAEDGTSLPEGREGELCFRGPSVTAGYFENPQATALTFRDGWLHTGDLGYLMDGEVYVTGRLKDLIILNGRNLHPQAIEWAVAEVEGVRKGNVVAFSRIGADSEELVIALETRAEDLAVLTVAVRKAVQRELQLTVADVVCLEPGTLPKTSSGKLQRRKTRQQYLAGALGTQGTRLPGTTDRLTLARHVAKSFWSRAKNAVLG